MSKTKALNKSLQISSLDCLPNYPTVPSKSIDNLWNYPRDNQRPNKNTKKICWQLSLKFGNTKLFKVPPHTKIHTNRPTTALARVNYHNNN